MEGSKALHSRFDGLINIDTRVRAIVRNNADDISARTKSNAPVDTGKLRSGVNVSMSGSAHQSKAVITANAYNKGFNYGLYQERYNRRGKSEFMERAFKAVEPKFKKEMMEAISKR
ncbi:hypothetical protein pwc_53 [Weissella phage PWc]|nr:hypothetical protein pwc_53 [Weissella phage PWc]